MYLTIWAAINGALVGHLDDGLALLAEMGASLREISARSMFHKLFSDDDILVSRPFYCRKSDPSNVNIDFKLLLNTCFPLIYDEV